METGWTFRKILQFHVRHVFGDLQNVISYGCRKRSDPFDPRLSTSFRYNVRDPYTFIDKRSNENICIPAAVIVCLEHEFGTKIVSRLTATEIKMKLNALNFISLLDVYSTGIRLSDLHLFEKLNTPLEKKLLTHYPLLKGYSGLAINVFTIHRSEQLNCFTLFPKQLSKNHRDTNFLQIDLLVDTPSIRAKAAVGVAAGTSKKESQHVLAILNLARLLISFKSNEEKLFNSHRFQFPCRACATVYNSGTLYKAHIQTCNTFGSGRITAGKRKSQNRFIHKTKITLVSSGKTVPHSIHFKRGNLIRTIRPFSFSCLDFESSNRIIENAKEDPNTPNNATFQQKALGFSFTHKNCYTEYPIPDSLRAARILFFDEHKFEVKHFYLRLFMMIRADILLLHKYHLDILSRDEGVPTLSSLTTAEKIEFLAKERCDCCGIKFGILKKNSNGKFYKIKKVIDHSHVLMSKGGNGLATDSASNKPRKLRFVCCQGNESVHIQSFFLGLNFI